MTTSSGLDLTLLANLGTQVALNDADGTGGSSTNAGGVGGAKFDAATFALIEWDAEVHGVGVRSIDDQHQQLIEVIDQLCRLGRQINSPAPADGAATVGGASPRSLAAAVANGMSAQSPALRPVLGSMGVVAPMSIKGALMMDMQRFSPAASSNTGAKGDTKPTSGRGGADCNADATNADATKARAPNLMSASFGGTAQSGNSNASSGGGASSGVSIYATRAIPTRCAKYVDRGLPPELQRGGLVEPLLEQLVVHCSVRLIQEEHNLEAVSFADRGAHALEHQTFVREVFRAYQLMEGSNFELTDLANLLRFLRLWIRDHIPKDRRFAPLMLEKQHSAK